MKSIEVKLENRTLVVQKLPLKKYADLLNALQKLPTHLSGLDKVSNEKLIEMLPSIIADSFEDIVAVFTVATDLKKEEVEEMGLDEATDVFVAVMEVNDYRNIYEKVKKAFGQPTAQVEAKTGTGGR